MHLRFRSVTEKSDLVINSYNNFFTNHKKISKSSLSFLEKLFRSD